MKDKKLHCKCFVRDGQPNKREEDEGEEESSCSCAGLAPDKHSASVQPHSSTGGAGKEEGEEGEA